MGSHKHHVSTRRATGIIPSSEADMEDPDHDGEKLASVSSDEGMLVSP